MFLKCFACGEPGEIYTVTKKKGFKHKPWMDVPMCDRHGARFKEKGLMYVVRDNRVAKKYLEENGWFFFHGGYRRPALDYESE